MNNKALLFGILIASGVASRAGSRFELTRQVVAGGGTTSSTSARFQLGGTIAQAFANSPAVGNYVIQEGFWIKPAPIIFAPAKTGDNFVFSFQSEAGKNYRIEYTDSLFNPNWQPLATLSGDGATKSETNSAPSITQQYFRLIEY